MTDVKFDELWEQIANVAQDIENSCPGIKFNKDKKAYIQYEYDNLRSHCRQYLQKNNDSNDDISETHTNSEKPLLDRHKVAACISGAILRAKPMETETKNANKIKPTKLYFFCNESLALFSALGIVQSFIRSDTENVIKIESKLKDAFLESGFIFPTPQKSDYLPWLLFVLRESSQIGFNALSFSNILFLLEEHSLSKLEIHKLNNNK